MLYHPTPSSARRLLVAVHDVTPAHARRIERILELFEQLDLERFALLVVPNWHGAWPLEQHPDFVEELRRCRRAGAEILLHGFRHDEDGHNRSFLDRLRVAGRTAHSAEFMMLAADETASRIEQGVSALALCGLEPVGFVPPAWLAGPHTLRALRDSDLAVTEGFWAIVDTRSGRRLFAPALSWSTARAWRSTACAGIAVLRQWIERRRMLVRVAIHPPDIDHPVVARSLRTALERLLAVRKPISYREALQAIAR